MSFFFVAIKNPLPGKAGEEKNQFAFAAAFFALRSLRYHGRYASPNIKVITAIITAIRSAKLGGRISNTEGVDSGRAIYR